MFNKGTRWSIVCLIKGQGWEYSVVNYGTRWEVWCV